MNTQRDTVWKRRGFSLLWDAKALSSIINPADVISIRQFFAMSLSSWPKELPGSDGDALVVAGLEGGLDALMNNLQDGMKWIEEDLRPLILGFQDEYQGEAALIFWLPSGHQRIDMDRATERYYWKIRSLQGSTDRLPLGQCLWGGAESDVRPIFVSDAPRNHRNGKTYIGLYHPRIS